MGCHSGQNYAFTILGNLAVSLSNLLSGTVQLIKRAVQLKSGTVQLIKWDYPTYKWDYLACKWDIQVEQKVWSTYTSDLVRCNSPSAEKLATPDYFYFWLNYKWGAIT